MAENARQFFETLEARAGDSSKAAGLNATYLFDIDGAGKWIVRVENGPWKGLVSPPQIWTINPFKSSARPRVMITIVITDAFSTGRRAGNRVSGWIFCSAFVSVCR